MGVLKQGSLSEELISVLAQVGMATRKMLSAEMYHTVNAGTEDESTERFTANTKQLGKAVARIREKGYITEVKDGGKKYYCLTPLGWHYAQSHGMIIDEGFIREGDIGSIKNRSAILSHAYALYLARSMRVFSLSVEKPEFGDFCNKVGAFTVFRTHDEEREESFPKDYILNGLLSNGVCYSRREIRKAYEESSNHAMENNSSRQLGMIFKNDKIISLIGMDSKNTVLTLRAEQEFNKIVMEDTGNRYGHFNSVPLVAYILAPSMIYMPTFFHGYPDGIEPKKKANIPVTESAKSKFKLEKLPQYSEVYMMPMAPTAAAYREALYNYTKKDYEADETRFRRMHPDVGRCVMCRYPNLTQLRKFYSAKESVTVAGPSDPVMVDMISRCLRNRMRGYYDIDTGAAVPYRRYNAYGYPLIGNTEQIDHEGEWKINTKFRAAEEK